MRASNTVGALGLLSGDPCASCSAGAFAIVLVSGLIEVETLAGEKTVIVASTITHLTATNLGTQVHLASGKALTVRRPLAEVVEAMREAMHANGAASPPSMSTSIAHGD